MSVILLVLDGLGIGEMPDVAIERPQDRGANTLRSLMQMRHLHTWIIYSGWDWEKSLSGMV